MAGGRSMGCRTCKNRRIKCDERKPVCVQCEKGRRACTGVESPFRYEYKSGQQAQHTIIVVNQSLADSSPRSLPVKKLPRKIRQFHFIHTIRPDSFKRRKSRHVGPGSFQSPTRPHTPEDDLRLAKEVILSFEDKLAASLIAALDIKAFGYRLRFLGTYWTMLPARIGHCPALDAAIDGILVCHSAMLRPHPSNDSGVLVRYSSALKALQHALASSLNDPSAETLSAALVVSFIEVLQQSPKTSFLELSGGVSALFQAWGPDRIRTDFELALFESHLGSMVIHPLIFNRDCFLDDPSWKSLLTRLPRVIGNVSVEILSAMTPLSALVRGVRCIASSPTPDDLPVLLNTLRRRCTSFRAEIQRHAPYDENDSPPQNPALPDIFHCADPLQPSLDPLRHGKAFEHVKRHALYYTALIIANSLLSRLGIAPPSHIHQTRHAALMILGLVPLALACRPLGAFFIQFCAGVAYGVLEEDEQDGLVESVNVMFRDIRMTHSHQSLGMVFDLVTGAPTDVMEGCAGGVGDGGTAIRWSGSDGSEDGEGDLWE